MNRRGLPNVASGLTWTPSMITANSASVPIAASWLRSRVVDLFSGPFFFFSCVILTFYPNPSIPTKRSATSTSSFHIPRHRQHVTQIQVQVVFRIAGRSAVRTCPDAGQRLPRDQAKALDCTPGVQVGIADTIYIGGRPPGVRSGVLGEPMGRRAIPPVRRDVDQRPDGLPEPVKAHCQQRYCARNVPGESPEGRGLPHVDLDELPEQEIPGQFDLHRRIPGRDLIEIAWKLPQPPHGVLPILPRPQRLPIFGRQRQSVNDPEREVRRLILTGIAGKDRGGAHSSAGPWVRNSYMVCEIAAMVRDRPEPSGSHSVRMTRT